MFLIDEVIFTLICIDSKQRSCYIDSRLSAKTKTPKELENYLTVQSIAPTKNAHILWGTHLQVTLSTKLSQIGIKRPLEVPMGLAKTLLPSGNSEPARPIVETMEGHAPVRERSDVTSDKSIIGARALIYTSGGCSNQIIKACHCDS